MILLLQKYHHQMKNRPYLSRSRKEEGGHDAETISTRKEEINQLPNKDLHCLKSGMLYTKTSIITWVTWRNKMEKCAGKYTEESHPCSSTLVLLHLTIQITPNVTQKHQGALEGRTYLIWGISLYLSTMACILRVLLSTWKRWRSRITIHCALTI